MSEIKDNEVSRDVLIKRLMTENDIPWSSDLSGTIYIDMPVAGELWLSWDLNGEKMYFLTFHSIEEHVGIDGEPYTMAKQEGYCEMYFTREDMLLRFLMEVRDGSFDNFYMENLDEIRAETEETHKLWLLETYPQRVKENYPNWYESKISQMLQERFTKND